jgi:branched-chain amino acid transport system substrate-binding protein
VTVRRERWARRRVGSIASSVALLLAGTVGSAGAVVRSTSPAPIQVMTIGDFGGGEDGNAVWAHAVDARFAGANLSGGIADASGRRHRIVVVKCDSGLDERRAESCANRAARAGVAAVVGMNAIDSAHIWPTLEAAGIAVIGSRINTIADATSPVAFPLSAGLPGLFNAMPQLLQRAGARTVGVVISDYGAATDALLAFVDRGLALTGAARGPVVRVQPDASSLAAAAEAVTKGGTDGIIGFVSGPKPGSLLRQLERVGFGGSYVTQAPFGATRLASDPIGNESALLVGQFAPLSAGAPGMAEFKADMDLSRQGATLARTEGAVNGWLSAWVFERVVRRLPKVDAGSVLRAMNRLEHFDMGGITPPLTTTTSYHADLPRLFNPTVSFNRALHGATSPLMREFVDSFDGTPVSP